MAPEMAAEESKKRRRSQKPRQGPAASRKRRRADEDEVMEESGEDVAGNGDKEVTNTPTKTNETATSEKAKKTPQKATGTPSTTPKSSKKTGTPGGAFPEESVSLKLQKRQDDEKRQNAGVKEKYKGWSISAPIGGSYLSLDPQFTSDGKYLVAAKDHEVRLLSLEDSVVQETISAPAESVVTGFSVSPREPSRIYISFSNPSRVEQWDWMDTTALSGSTEVNGKIARINSAVVDSSGEEVVYTLADADEGSHIVRNGKSVFGCQSRLTDMTVFDNTCVCIGSGKLVLGTLHERGGQEAIFDLNFKATSLAVRKLGLKNPQKKSGISFDLALGSSTGEVFVYENVTLDSAGVAKSGLPTPRNLHWHREAVSSVKWSRDGNYLISGGKETVLVIWQLSSGKRQYLPHLSAEIEHITVSPSGTSYALQLADNSIMVLSTSELKPIAHFPDIQNQITGNVAQLPHDAGSQISSVQPVQQLRMAGTIHPIEQDSLLMTVPASAASKPHSSTRPFLQSFSVSAQRHQYRQALTRNSLTDLNTGPNGLPIQSPDVSKIAISPNGKVLVTVECWTPLNGDYSFLALDEEQDQEAKIARREVYLKFWNWDGNNSRWALETRISNPHPLGTSLPGAVLDLVADPTGSRFFTLGTDSTIRLWTHKASDWTCKTSITMPPSTTIAPVQTSTPESPLQIGSLAVSQDASLLACSSPHSSPYSSTSQIQLVSITGESGNVSLVSTHTLPPLPGVLHALAFEGRRLTAVTDFSLVAIDIPTLAQTAFYPLNPPKDRIPLAHRQRHLAVAGSDLAAIALPTSAPKTGSESADQQSSEPYTKVEIYSTASGDNKGKGRVFEYKIRGLVTGLYARRRGWVAVTADGKVFAVEPPAEGRGVLERIKNKESLVKEEEDEVERGIVEVDDAAVEPETGADAATDEMEIDQEEEGDKPVVRPEELARLFETKAGVRDMFEEVMRLFARRPVKVM
ncbi:hypothetical protein BDZ85DRAFT_257698 [Elsinoe ampelina]|uniref:Uncharacterized protein n=1 Tax=Elsinoe ampelina TaxID=302913 RepID=A0A6A6GIK2_9PEZI|nr:hypothetical protein BDZ85DRAFT_257698 [Elsinoe ampelina]